MTSRLPTESQTAVAKRNGQPARATWPTVLVVEDHEDTRFLIRMLLEMRGVRVLEAENGWQAIELAEHARPSLILMDGGLPGQDGFTTTRRLRENNSFKDVPIVLLSAHVEPYYQSLAQASGCDDYLVKPFEIKQLDAILERRLFCQTSQA